MESYLTASENFHSSAIFYRKRVAYDMVPQV